jgi:hypothetical protein
MVVDLYTGDELTCGCWDAAKRLCGILAKEVGSTMDIVHCWDAVWNFGHWYPQYQKRCLYRTSQLPTVKALRLPYIEKAKDISLGVLVQLIYKGLTKIQTIRIFWHYYGINWGPLRKMERVDLAQKLAEQLVLDSVGRGGNDDKEEEEVPAPFTVYQIQQVLQSAQNPSKPVPEPEEEEIAQNPSKPDPESEEEEIAQNPSKPDLKRSHSSMEVNTAVKDGGGSMTSFETRGANHVKKCSIRRRDGKHFHVTIMGNVHVDGKLLNGCDNHPVKEFTSSKTQVAKVIGMVSNTFSSYLETNKCSKEYKTFEVKRKKTKWTGWEVKLG